MPTRQQNAAVSCDRAIYPTPRSRCLCEFSTIVGCFVFIDDFIYIIEKWAFKTGGNIFGEDKSSTRGGK